MSKNREQLASLLARAYDALKPKDVRRILDEAERISKGDGHMLHVHRKARELQVDRLDFADNTRIGSPRAPDHSDHH